MALPAASAGLDRSSGELRVSIDRVAYDAEAVFTEIREFSLPAEYADKLLVAA